MSRTLLTCRLELVFRRSYLPSSMCVFCRPPIPPCLCLYLPGERGAGELRQGPGIMQALPRRRVPDAGACSQPQDPRIHGEKIQSVAVA